MKLVDGSTDISIVAFPSYVWDKDNCIKGFLAQEEGVSLKTFFEFFVIDQNGAMQSHVFAGGKDIAEARFHGRIDANIQKLIELGEITDFNDVTVIWREVGKYTTAKKAKE